MAGNEPGPAGLPLGQHRRLHRSHIGEHSLGGQGIQQLLGGSQQAVKGQSQHHQSAVSQHPGVRGDLIGQPPLASPLGGGIPVNQGMNPRPPGAKVKGKGSTNQAHTHDSHRVIAPQHCHSQYGPLGTASYDFTMLEARAHHQLKQLLRLEGSAGWPHHLTLSRLVARSLRRGDQTLVRLSPGCDSGWLMGLLVPLALSETPVALVASPGLRQRLLLQELPRLKAVGLQLPCWEGSEAPPSARLWLLSHQDLVAAWRQNTLGERQLVIPEAEGLEAATREALGTVLKTHHWDALRRSLPSAEASVLALHERLSRRIFSRPATPSLQVALSPEEEAPLGQLLHLLGPLPEPWPRWLETRGQGWTSWANVDPQLLQWDLHRQPLEPLEEMEGLLRGRGALLIGSITGGSATAPWPAASQSLGFEPRVSVNLVDPPLQDPLPIHAPLRQALPNSPDYGQHLLEHGRRLVLGQEGLTVVLLDDAPLRLGLSSGLAGEFGSRVVHQSTAPDSNGVLCCSWQWWLDHQERLPVPNQILVALLPISSLEDPLTAARVAALRQQGRDWFRELLLPEALDRIQRAVAGLRRGGGRLALLDGRVRRRGWGRQVLEALEPWVDLPRLLPR